MDISKMNKKVFAQPGDGAEYALIKGKTVYMISAQDIEEAMAKLKKQAGVPNNWKVSTEKAVLIPGIWEYQMATFQGAA